MRVEDMTVRVTVRVSELLSSSLLLLFRVMCATTALVDDGVSHATSGASLTSACCRICHTGASRERLVSPCQCKGSLAHVHLSCLERWLNQAGRRECELCCHHFRSVRTRRYMFCESIRVWLGSPHTRTHMQADLLICGLLTVVTGGLLAVCLFGMRYFLIEGSKLGVSDTWTRGSVGIFLAVVLAGYVVTLYLLGKDQIVPWYRWWRTTVNVRLVVDNVNLDHGHMDQETYRQTTV